MMSNDLRSVLTALRKENYIILANGGWGNRKLEAHSLRMERGLDQILAALPEGDLELSDCAAGAAYWERDGERFVATIEASAQGDTLDAAVQNVTRFVATAWPEPADWPERKEIADASKDRAFLERENASLFDRAEQAEARSSALLIGAQRLIETWRDYAGGQGAIYAQGITECADELDALLSGVSVPPLVSKEP